MKRLYPLVCGLVVLISNLSFGQNFPTSTPINFPTANTFQASVVVEPLVYHDKNFVTTANSIASGNWNEPGTWDCGCVPTFQDDVNINSGHEITINQDVNFTSIFIDTAAVLTAENGVVRSINFSGDWVNNGNFVANSSQVILSGFDSQSITGTTEFHNLSVLHNRDINIMSPVTIFDKLTVEDASVNTNDQLILGYTNGKTAEISRILTGSIVGKITAQSSVDLAEGSWFATASPVQNATISEWNDDLLTTGFEGADFPDYTFNNILYFTEYSGYQNATSINDTIHPGVGYFIYENPGTHPYDITGYPVIGNFTFPVTYTDTVDTENKGWNLLGNPFVSTINWNNSTGWNKNNIGEALYVWDEVNKTYKVFMHGYAVNGGSPIIAPFDNFFVSTVSNPELTINENAKQEGAYEAEIPENNFFKFHLTGEATSDEIIVILDENASEEYQINNDAIRVFGTNKTELATSSSDSVNLCISSLPMNNLGMDIPLIINSPSGGAFTLEINAIPEGINACMALENTITNEIYNLLETTSIPFVIDSTEAETVFVLHIGGTVQATTSQVTCNGQANASITATGSGNGNWDYFWYDQDNNLIASDLNNSGSSTLDSLAPGTYSLVIDSLDFCPSLTQTIEITEPEALTVSADILQPGCNAPNSGEIIAMPTGGTGNYSYSWSNGTATSTNSNLAGGTYTVIVTDENGCQSIQSYDLDDATVVNALFDVDEIIPLTGGLNEVSFSNSSDNASNYLWNFGDGDTSTDENPTHTYSNLGQYIVALTAYQGECSTTYNYVLVVEASTVAVEEIQMNDDILLLNDNANYSLSFDLNSNKEVEISILNLLGQQLSSESIQVKKEKYKLDFPSKDKQIYFVVVTVNDRNEKPTKKTFRIIK